MQPAALLNQIATHGITKTKVQPTALPNQSAGPEHMWMHHKGPTLFVSFFGTLLDNALHWKSCAGTTIRKNFTHRPSHVPPPLP